MGTNFEITFGKAFICTKDICSLFPLIGNDTAITVRTTRSIKRHTGALCNMLIVSGNCGGRGVGWSCAVFHQWFQNGLSLLRNNTNIIIQTGIVRKSKTVIFRPVIKTYRSIHPIIDIIVIRSLNINIS